MYESHDIEKELKAEAIRISEQYNGAPVVIVMGVSDSADIPRVMTASSIQGRLRDLLGVLQASIQVESWKHFQTWK